MPFQSTSAAAARARADSSIAGVTHPAGSSRACSNGSGSSPACAGAGVDQYGVGVVSRPWLQVQLRAHIGREAFSQSAGLWPVVAHGSHTGIALTFLPSSRCLEHLFIAQKAVGCSPVLITVAGNLPQTFKTGFEPTPRLVAWAVENPASMFRFNPDTIRRLSGEDQGRADGEVVESLRVAHRSTEKYTVQLEQAREQRRVLAAVLHARGHSYRWIGEQIGVTAQAVEGFIKYQRRRRQRQGDDTTTS